MIYALVLVSSGLLGYIANAASETIGKPLAIGLAAGIGTCIVALAVY